jgi:hypothetical protein
MFWAFGNGGEGLSGWLGEGFVILGGGLWYGFIWVETLASSSWRHYRGHFRAYNNMGAKCWDQTNEGYLTPNTREECNGGKRSHERTTRVKASRVLRNCNKCWIPPLGGIPMGPIYMGGWGGNNV